MGTLIQHLQDFARENKITRDKFIAGFKLVRTLTDFYHAASSSSLTSHRSNESGHMSASLRNEGQLLCNVIGLEALVDDLTYVICNSTSVPTTTRCLGLFLHPAPEKDTGTSIFHGILHGDHTLCMVR